eukprot:16247-Heterococcus_DN1.PRE.8
MSALAAAESEGETEFTDDYRPAMLRNRPRTVSVQFGDAEFSGALCAFLKNDPDFEHACVDAAYAEVQPKRARKKSVPTKKVSAGASSSSEQVAKPLPVAAERTGHRGKRDRDAAAAAAAPAAVVPAESNPPDEAVCTLLRRVCRAATGCAEQLEHAIELVETDLYKILAKLCEHDKTRHRLLGAFKKCKK